EIANAECVGRFFAYRPRAVYWAGPSAYIIVARLRRFVAPDVEGSFDAAARRALPFGLPRQSIPASADFTPPFSKDRRCKPAHRYYWLIGMVEVGIAPLRRGRIAGRLEEAGEIAIAHLVDGHLEGIHPDTMDRLLLVAALLAAHLKITRRNRGADRPF